MPLAIFDDHAGRWGPLTDRRPVFDLRSGALTLRARIERTVAQPADALLVPPRLAAVVAERDPCVTVNPTFTSNNGAHWLIVNGRWTGLEPETSHEAPRLAALPPDSAVRQPDGTLVAAHLAPDDAHQLRRSHYTQLPDNVKTHTLAQNILLERPWHLLDQLDALLRADLDASDLPEARDDLPPGAHLVGDHAVRIAPTARLRPGLVINAEQGPVAIDAHAVVQPFAVLEGPCYLGAHCELAPHTSIRADCAIGPHCKLGGEVKATIIQGHSNKAHLGCLGDSILGQWVNLGADTNVSNLKNTYGHVRIQLEPDTEPEDTQRTLHGPIIGDFVRTAIGSRLLTGSVLGTGAMLARSDMAPKHLPRFAFDTDAGRAAHDLDALLKTANEMTKRRHVTLTENEADLLRALHTRATAQLA